MSVEMKMVLQAVAGSPAPHPTAPLPRLAVAGNPIIHMVLDASLPRLLVLSIPTMNYVFLRQGEKVEGLLIRDGLLITVGIKTC